ncbi:MAG TPA: Gfo/Idh/MocA family oxidoreductase [Planctomycetota bacterium]|nr:Gfo/Idh/MocA family oxidoreductase [Planctomycetota bacterium]
MTREQPFRASSPSSTTRREILALTAAAAGATLLAANSASAAERFPTPQKGRVRAAPKAGEPVKIGVIGVGDSGNTPAMGYAHCERICALAKEGREKVQIVAISDVAEPYLKRAVEMCSKEQGLQVAGHKDYRELLARDDLHGVLIATPEHWHAKMAMDAIQAGLDVYLEKPMTLHVEEALALRAVVHANDRILQVGTQFLQHPKYHKAKELIASGAIGKPTFSQTSYCRNSKSGEWLYKVDPAVVPGPVLDWDTWCGPNGKAAWNPEVYFRWRRFRQWSTGVIGDLLVHVTTPLVFALDVGWPTRVVAVGGHFNDTAMENHEQVNIAVEFEKGHTMTIAGSTCNETGVEILIRGHKANLYLASEHCVMRPEQAFAEEIDEQTFQSPPVPADQDSHRLQWLASIRSRQQPYGDVDTAAKVMVIVDLATKSLWTKSAYSFDPKSLTVARA